jgi:hypothetical protein
MNSFGRNTIAITLALTLFVGGVAHVAEAHSNDRDDNNYRYKNETTYNNNWRGNEHESRDNNKHQSNQNQIKPLPWKMRLEIGFNGRANISGTVDSVSNNTFTLKSWGGVWTITTGSSTKFTQRNSSMSTLRVGDTVQIKGTLATSTTAWTIAASEVKNKSFTPDRVTPPTATTTAATTLRIATVQSIGSSTLNVKLNNGSLFAVIIDGTTKVFNRRLQPLSLSSIMANHRLAVFGTTTNTTMNASVIQDLSI